MAGAGKELSRKQKGYFIYFIFPGKAEGRQKANTVRRKAAVVCRARCCRGLLPCFRGDNGVPALVRQERRPGAAPGASPLPSPSPCQAPGARNQEPVQDTFLTGQNSFRLML